MVGPADLELVGLYMRDMLLVEPFAISKNCMALGGQAYLLGVHKSPRCKSVENTENLLVVEWWLT